MKTYVITLTKDEVNALYAASGNVPHDDYTSSLAKIFDYMDSNIIEHRWYNHNCNHLEELIKCKI